ncbi:hypothetical protein G6F35_017564 [Rhizopus arrhizus]|nr:hypothetical protein G6F35_017564 [Rhizopus arrhizus]
MLAAKRDRQRGSLRQHGLAGIAQGKCAQAAAVADALRDDPGGARRVGAQRAAMDDVDGAAHAQLGALTLVARHPQRHRRGGGAGQEQRLVDDR